MAAKTPIPQNIRRIRTSRDLTQEEVAQKAGISRNAFRSIEAGAAEPRVSNLQGIARALRVGLPDLLAEPPRLATVRFRSRKLRGSKGEAIRDQIIVEVSRWLKDFNSLEELLNERKDYALADLRDPLTGLPGQGRPAKAARLTREAAGLREDEPIRDICGLLASVGVKVLTRKIDIEGMFGLSVDVPDGGPAVVVNVRDDISVERRIFTSAHELGHLLLHPRAYDLRKVDEDPGEEKEADLFAGHFLMPDAAFRKEWRNTSGLPFVDRVLHVKRIFRVSYQTVLFRLVELRLADPSKTWMIFKGQCKQRYGAALTRKVEPEGLVEAEAQLEPKGLDAPDFVEDRLSRLVRQAVESEKITLSRGAEILGLDLHAMRERAASWEVAA